MFTGQFAVSRKIDRELVFLLGIQIEQVQVAAILEHDRVRPQAWPVHIKIREMRELFDLMRGQAVAVQVQAMFRPAIGIEINGVAVPHGKRVGPFRVRHLLDVLGLEIVDPDVLRHAARYSASRCGSSGRCGCRRCYFRQAE